MTAITATGPGRARTMTPARALRHALTLAWRSLVRIRRNPEQLLDVTLQPIVFVTLFVFLFGGAIKGESRHTYLQYVLPGIRIAANPLSALGAAGLMFVFGFAVGWIWVLLGLYVKSPQSLQGFGFIVMFPLTFGSNVFIQASTLPGWLQAWVRINPVTALAGASRGLMLGGPVATPAWHSVAWSIAITVVFAPLAVRRYRRIG